LLLVKKGQPAGLPGISRRGLAWYPGDSCLAATATPSLGGDREPVAGCPRQGER